jgi:hypothetical protein
MPENSRRTRSISLRLSEEEYEALQKLHRSYGARNVSDFARMAIQGLIGPAPSTDGLLMAKLHQLDVRLDLVEQRVARLASEPMAAAATT